MASVAYVEETLRSTKEKANFQRLTRLLMYGGIQLLRENFDSCHPPADLPLKLADPAIQAKLRTAKLLPPEWRILYPSPGVFGKSSDFDITLTFRLLRTICGLTAPSTGWNSLPANTDRSIEADLVRIKFFRNSVYGHTSKMEITDSDFLKLWTEIREALLRIAGSLSTAKKDEWNKWIEDLLHDPLTPEAQRYAEDLKVWYEKDLEVKYSVIQLGDRVDQPHSDMQAIRQDSTDVKDQIRLVDLKLDEIKIQIETMSMCLDDQQGENTEGNPSDSSTVTQIWKYLLLIKRPIEQLLEYLKGVLRVEVKDYREGSLVISVTCSSLQALERLWDDYCSGHLSQVVQQLLVTPEVLKELGLSRLQLRTTITKEEYVRYKDIFLRADQASLQVVTPSREKLNIAATEDIGDSLYSRKVLGVSTTESSSFYDIKSSVMEKSFSALTEARKEVKRRQTLFLELCVSTEALLNMMSDKDYALLELGVKNLRNQLAYHIQRLEREEYLVLLSGERDPKKSALLSLILGEKPLPDSFFGTSSVVCELRYGKTHKLVAHYKDADPQTGLPSKTIQPGEMAGNSQHIFLQKISWFFQNEDLQGSGFDKIEIFWPNNLLKEGIVVVDSPEFGKSPIVDVKVKAYLSEALAVICVIDSLTQQQRMKETIKQCRRLCLDHLETASICPLFLCANWHQLSQKEADSRKNHVVRQFREYWPEVDPDSQIIHISSPYTTNYGTAVAEFVSLMDAIKSNALQNNKATLQMQWRWLDSAISRMAYHLKMVMELLCPSTDRKIVSDLHAERLRDVEMWLCSVEYELQEHFRKLAEDAVRVLSNHLQSCEVMEKFTSWTLDDIPHAGESWEVTEHLIKDAFQKRLQNTIAAWEEKNQILSYTRSSLVKLSHQRFDKGESLLPFRYLEKPVITDAGASGSQTCQSSNDFSAAQKVMIGLTSPISVPVGLAVLVGSFPLMGVMKLKEKATNFKRSREYERDKQSFIVQASREYLRNVAQEQQLWLFVEKELKDVQVYLTKVSSCLRELTAAEKILCQQLRDETRSGKEIKESYGPLEEMSVRIKEKMALFFIKELQSTEISHNDLEWDRDDPTSLLGNGAFASVYRGTFRLPGQSEPTQVAVKLWIRELNESTAIGFFFKAETLRKLDFPFIVKFFGRALLKEVDRLRVIDVLEFCEENLMNHIFQNPKNIPGFSGITSAKKNVLCWAKDIAAAIEFVHNQGIVHRGLKLEKILLSHRNVVKVSGFRLSEEAKIFADKITGTDAYLAPEVIRYKEYDNKADIYSFGIMLWEMWYSKRALLEEEGHVSDKEAKGARPSYVQDAIKPPTGWQDLMQRCWGGKPHIRPDAAECHKLLTVLSQEVYEPPL